MRSLFLIVLCTLTQSLFGQTGQIKTVPYVKTGYGYFNDELMIHGNVLSSELGIKLKTGYIFSIKVNFADALNDIAYYPYLPDYDLNFIYSYKWVSLNMGYEFMTKNRRHSVIPMMGPFYSSQLKTYPLDTNEGGLEIRKDIHSMVGIDLTLQYLYNFTNGISVGLIASGCLAYQYGPTYLTILPIVVFKLN